MFCDFVVSDRNLTIRKVSNWDGRDPAEVLGNLD